MKINKSIIFFATIFWAMNFSVTGVLAQCPGNYFKTQYRNVGATTYGYALADWNSDGRPDFYKAQVNSSNNTLNLNVYLHTGSSDWNFANPLVYTTDISSSGFGGYYFDGQLIDIDSDGDLDVVRTGGGGALTTFRNNGNNTITELGTTTFPGESTVGGLPLTDLNGDGLLDRVDVIGVPGQGHSIGYRLGQANGTFGARVNLLTKVGLGNYPLASGDFTGDGKKDIIFGDFGSQGEPLFRVFKNMEGGNFEIIGGHPRTGGLGFVRDYNNDGKDDYLSVRYDSETPHHRLLWVYFSVGDGTFSETQLPVYNVDSFNTGTNNAELKIAEINGDSNPDIIEMGKGFYSIHLNNGSGGFSRTDYFRELPAKTFFDHNGDGKDDLYADPVQNIFGEQVISVRQNICSSFGETKRANFDADVFADLVFWNPNSGDWVSRDGQFNNQGEPNPTFNWGLGSLSDIPALGDFDGDGKTDYTVYRNDTGEWYVFRSSDSVWSVTKFGLPGDIPIPNDYDGGGNTDIAVFRPSDGNWYILSSETQQFSAIHWGASGDKPVPEDFDGDGKTDIAVYRPGDGNWYYLKSSDQDYVILHWGIDTDKPLPADYDGDGKADLAVYRDGDWYILRSLNNSFGFIHWGTAGDFPIPIYRSETIADIVVYRPSNNYWYNNTSGTLVEVFGNGQNLPIYFGRPNN